MGSHVLTHDGFQGSIEVSVEDNCLFGRLLHIDDLVTYEGDTPEELHSAFINAIKDYLALCKEQGKEANKPFKGSLNVRLGTDLHEQAAKKAVQTDRTLNDFIRDAVSEYVAGHHFVKTEIVHRHEHRYYSVSNNIAGTEFDFLDETTQWQESKPAHH